MGFVKQLITGGGHIVLYVGLIGDVPLVLWYATVMPLFLCGGGVLNSAHALFSMFNVNT